jgi:ribosomal protein S18 acetylase RimI-like enzyme
MPIGNDQMIRNAVREDVPAIVALLADDPLGRSRESTEVGELDPYLTAFDAIAADPNNELLLAVNGGRVVGVLQITFSPGLSRKGAWRATLESVRVATDVRGTGIGRTLVSEAITRARARNCQIVQLTTDLSRAAARAFYESLGFSYTHAGMKLSLAAPR